METPYAPPERLSDPDNFVPAGHVRRVVAWFVDRLITLGLSFGSLYALSFAFHTAEEVAALVSKLQIPLTFGVPVLYFGLLECSRLQGSLGKRLLGLWVIDVEGARLSLWRSLARSALRTVVGALWVFDLVVLGNQRRRAVWDFLAGTRVVMR